MTLFVYSTAIAGTLALMAFVCDRLEQRETRRKLKSIKRRFQ